MRVLVCGGRNYENKEHVWSVLDEICNPEGDFLPIRPVTIIHGGAEGADLLADGWAVHNWVEIEEYLADWDTYGRAAGPIRNQRMLDEGKPDLVIAFPGGRGTADMVRRARAAGMPVHEFEEHE
jgi:hypothetical protein